MVELSDLKLDVGCGAEQVPTGQHVEDTHTPENSGCEQDHSVESGTE